MKVKYICVMSTMVFSSMMIDKNANFNLINLEKEDTVILNSMPDEKMFSNILKKSKGLIIVNDINNTRRYINNNNEYYNNDNQNISVDGFIGANYYFLEDNEVKKGNIITDGNPQNLKESIKKVENDLNMEAYSNYSSSFEISDEWELLTEQNLIGEWNMRMNGMEILVSGDAIIYMNIMV